MGLPGSAFSRVLAAALAALPTRGRVSGSPCWRHASVRNRPAAAWARGSGGSKAIAGPCGATARARYRPAPCTFIPRLLQAPTAPARPRAAGQGGLPRRAVLAHPPVEGRGSAVEPACEPEFCAGARAQGREATAQRPPLRLRAWGKCAPLPLIAIVALLSGHAASQGKSIPQIASYENLRQSR